MLRPQDIVPRPGPTGPPDRRPPASGLLQRWRRLPRRRRLALVAGCLVALAALALARSHLASLMVLLGPGGAAGLLCAAGLAWIVWYNLR